MVEIFQYISEYSELYKELISLKRYKFIKRKKINKSLNDLGNTICSLDIHDLLCAMYNYIHIDNKSTRYYSTKYVGCKEYYYDISYLDSGMIAIDIPEGYIQYYLDNKEFKVVYEDSIFYISKTQPLKNSRLQYIWDCLLPIIYDLVMVSIIL